MKINKICFTVLQYSIYTCILLLQECCYRLLYLAHKYTPESTSSPLSGGTGNFSPNASPFLSPFFMQSATREFRSEYFGSGAPPSACNVKQIIHQQDNTTTPLYLQLDQTNFKTIEDRFKKYRIKYIKKNPVIRNYEFTLNIYSQYSLYQC